MFTVSDFHMLLSKDNLVPLIVFSALFGAATSLSSAKGEAMGRFLESGMEFFYQYTVYAKEGEGEPVIIVVTIAKADATFTPPVPNATVLNNG